MTENLKKSIDTNQEVEPNWREELAYIRGLPDSDPLKQLLVKIADIVTWFFSAGYDPDDEIYMKKHKEFDDKVAHLTMTIWKQAIEPYRDSVDVPTLDYQYKK